MSSLGLTKTTFSRVTGSCGSSAWGGVSEGTDSGRGVGTNQHSEQAARSTGRNCGICRQMKCEASANWSLTHHKRGHDLPESKEDHGCVVQEHLVQPEAKIRHRSGSIPPCCCMCDDVIMIPKERCRQCMATSCILTGTYQRSMRNKATCPLRSKNEMPSNLLISQCPTRQ